MSVFVRRVGQLAAAVCLACWLPVSNARAVATTPAEAQPVKAWQETVNIPTYGVADPDPDPMFYFGRNYQGAEGRVYPYPLYDMLTNVKADKAYQMLYLENEYVRIGILPELGGRVFEAVDKSNNYDFVYHQHSVKPALVGMLGAWISGGIEWNIPHHHRATTLLPVQAKIEENADGSKTVWVGELELRDRMRWAVGYTLRPGKSVLECTVRIINRTPVANNMLCFANVAVHANENYQVIFPPSTQYVTFHGKHEFTTWPIATTMFNGADFTKGVDVSWYKNHEAANSMFAWNYQDDFFAGYDHGKNAGIVSVADHEVVPGKKFWTWGNGPYGKMWDNILTDADGPYIELMVGAYSDNQPDYSWLAPYETKSLQMNWYPLRDIDGLKKANLDAAMNLEITQNDAAKTRTAKFGFCATSARRQAAIKLQAGDRVLVAETVDIDPAHPYVKQVSIPSGIDEHDLRASLSAEGKELISYSPVRLEKQPMPEPVAPPPAPKEMKSVEELYLAGQRIQQFQAPGVEPEPYWQEALARDPENSQVNTALGIRELKRAKVAEAEQHFRTAIKRLAKNYTSPKNGEPFYYLGVTLQEQGKYDEAYDALFKATWSEAWRGPAYFAIAQIDARRRDYQRALEHVDRSLSANNMNLPALNLKTALLRRAGRTQEALALVDDAAGRVDPLDVCSLWQRTVMTNRYGDSEMADALKDHSDAVLEAAVELSNAGFWDDSEKLLTRQGPKRAGKSNPSAAPDGYFLAEAAKHVDSSVLTAGEYRNVAQQMPPDQVFLFQPEMISILRAAIQEDSKDARAPFYLGNLLFDWQPEEAVKLWQQSAAIDPNFAIVHRNLAAAYAHQKPTADNAKAIAELEKAVACPQKYALHFTELDELYAANRTAPEKRLALLEQNQDVVAKRDDALSREIGLKVFAGKYDEAIRLMTGRKFAVWEGGTLDVTDHWVNAHLLRGRDELARHRFAEALADFAAAKAIPENLPAGRNGNDARSAEIEYWTGLACEGLPHAADAQKAWRAAAGAAISTPRRGFNGRMLEREVQAYYQALAKQKLGQSAAAQSDFRAILAAGQQALQSSEEGPAAAEATIRAAAPRNRAALAHYVVGLGHLGLGDKDSAKAEFDQALQATPDALGAHAELTSLTQPSSD